MQQIEQSTLFLANSSTHESMPYLHKLFEAVDDLIAECAEENSTDLTQLKRFVAGHVCREDLTEFEGHFKVSEKKRAPVNDWHSIMNLAKTQIKRRRFDEDTMECAQQMRKEFNGEDETASVVRAQVEERKKKLIMRKEENEKSFRATNYDKDIQKLNDNLGYMYANYGSHMILASANERCDGQLLYPPFVICNSGITY